MDTDVNCLLRDLHTGAMTLEEVAEKFRLRKWPRTRGPLPESYEELARQAQLDPEPDVPGSFDEVVAAYDRGEITREQYWTLVEAAAESMRTEADVEG